MKKIRVLITGASSGSVGEQVLEALRMAKTPYFLITTNVEPHKNGLYEADKGYLVPLAASKNYLSCLLKICQQEKVDVLVPGSLPELETISAKREIFNKNKILVLLNTADVIELCQDKLKTMEFLKNNKFLYPPFSLLQSHRLPLGMKFPLVIKPAKGSGGSRNVFLVQDQQELVFYFHYFKKYQLIPLVQEYLGSPDQEYTVGILTDFAGKFLGSIALKREVKGDLSTLMEVKDLRGRRKPLVLSSGFSQGIVDDYPDIRAYCQKIALALGSKGPLNIQCRKTSKGIYVMEINPRFSGTNAIRALLGFNEPDILIRRHLLKQKIGRLHYQKGLVLRDLRMIYVSFTKIKHIEKNGYINNRKSKSI